MIKFNVSAYNMAAALDCPLTSDRNQVDARLTQIIEFFTQNNCLNSAIELFEFAKARNGNNLEFRNTLEFLNMVQATPVDVIINMTSKGVEAQRLESTKLVKDLAGFLHTQLVNLDELVAADGEIVINEFYNFLLKLKHENEHSGIKAWLIDHIGSKTRAAILTLIFIVLSCYTINYIILW